MPDVAGDAMGPAIVDRNAIAGGALGFRFRAGWALFIDLFLKLLDLAEEVIEGAGSIDGVIGGVGCNWRSKGRSIGGNVVSLCPGLKNGVQSVVDEVVNLVGTVACSAGSGGIFTTVIVGIRKEGLEVNPGAFCVGFVPPLFAVGFE